MPADSHVNDFVTDPSRSRQQDSIPCDHLSLAPPSCRGADARSSDSCRNSNWFGLNRYHVLFLPRFCLMPGLAVVLGDDGPCWWKKVTSTTSLDSELETIHSKWRSNSLTPG